MSRYCIRLRSGSPHNCNGNVHGNVCGGWFHSSWISTIYALFNSWHKTLLYSNAMASVKSRKAFLTVMTDESVQVWGRRNHVYNVHNRQPLRCPHNSLLLNPRDQWQCTGSRVWAPWAVSGGKWSITVGDSSQEVRQHQPLHYSWGHRDSEKTSQLSCGQNCSSHLYLVVVVESRSW